MWRFVLLAIVIISVVIFGFSLADSSGTGGDVGASTLLTAADTDVSGFAQAIEPWDWQFPLDYGEHPDFQTEWWYYTGNLATDEGTTLRLPIHDFPSGDFTLGCQ